MFAQPSWLGRVQWDRQCSALPLFINGSFCSCKQHEYLIRPKIPSWLMNVSQPARQPLRGRGPPGTVAKQSSRTHSTLSWATQTVLHRGSDPRTPTRSDPPRVSRREPERQRWRRMHYCWCHFLCGEHACTNGNLLHVSAILKGLWPIKDYLFASLQYMNATCSSTGTERQREREREDADRHS